MTRKGEVPRAELMRRWPHHVALSADAVRGLDKSNMVRRFANTLSVAPLTYFLGRDFVVFCFAVREDAEAFCQRFAGERLPVRSDDGWPLDRG